MQKVACLLFLIIILSVSFVPKPTTRETIQWLSFEEVDRRMKQQELPVIVDIYTDWCGWCKVMDKNTYAKEKVAQYLNKKFYAVKFNAESKKDITWKGKTYRYNETKGIHELALTLITGEMGFPNTVFIPGKDASPQSVAGYLEPKMMQTFVTYFGENKHKEVDFESYSNSFRPSW